MLDKKTALLLPSFISFLTLFSFLQTLFETSTSYFPLLSQSLSWLESHLFTKVHRCKCTCTTLLGTTALVLAFTNTLKLLSGCHGSCSSLNVFTPPVHNSIVNHAGFFLYIFQALFSSSISRNFNSHSN